MISEREHTQAVQRIKVGLVGLAAVILLIGFASAIMRTVTRETPVTAIGAPKADVVANMVLTNAQGDTGEPLAELGIAPAVANGQGAAPTHH
ncbi:hypothetical protein [Sphingomonas bacterium]|uniref:hypothetical protein n=1 Tax=Sphingomonas bacterium TaxID=1895847 RepID=UPI0020C62CEC|nr:hypothetical protein [Sphingomonas bacterium]